MVTPDGFGPHQWPQAGRTGYLDGIRVDGQRAGRPRAERHSHSRKPAVVIEETDRDPRMAPWRDRLVQFGLRYVAAFPIQIAGDVAGSFQVYAPRAHFFDENELGLLTRMCDDVSFALTAMSDLVARKQAEADLNNANELNRQIVAGANDGIAVFNRDLRYLIWNAAMEKLTRKSASEVVGKRIFEAFPFLQETEVKDRVERVLAGQTCPKSKSCCIRPTRASPSGYRTQSRRSAMPKATSSAA